MFSGRRAANEVLRVFFLLVLIPAVSRAGDVYVDQRHTSVYAFLQEMGDARLIRILTVAKPYTRAQVATWLHEIDSHRAALNSRQQQDLDFFLRDYNKELLPGRFDGRRLDLFYYKDSLFTVSVNPVLGFRSFVNDSGGFFHRWGGGEAFAYIGSGLAMYARLEDNYEDYRRADPSYLNTVPGQVYKVDGVSPGGDFSEMTGGITWSWNWGSIGLVKELFTWGDAQAGSNILSGKAPSFGQIALWLHPASWVDFRYFHGWLVSGEIDTIHVYPNRRIYRPKYMAANLLTVTPVKHLDVSLGNSVVYGDMPVQAAYLVPFFFYKSVDHQLSGAGSNSLGQNSQMFFNISSRNIRNLHAYVSVFVDEVSFGDFFDSERKSNFISVKAGARLSNVPLQNVQLFAEFTRTRPVTYRHYIPTATYASNGYTLGHYLGDNAREVAVGATVTPLRGLRGDFRWVFAQKGEEYPYTGQAGTSGDGRGLPFLSDVKWQSSAFSADVRYEWLNDLSVFAGVTVSDQHGELEDVYSMPYYIGRQVTLEGGISIGF